MTVRDVQVVITGFGAVTGVGDDEALRAVWLAGGTGVRSFADDKDVGGLPPGYGARVDFPHKELRQLPGARGLRPGTMTEFTFLACAAVGRALRSAGIDDPEHDDVAVMDRRGVYLGSYTNFPKLKKHTKLAHVMGSVAEAEAGEYVIDDARIEQGMKGFTGFDFLKLMNNMPTAHAAIQAAARGPANTLLGHAPVGLQAIGRAVDGLRLDLADQFIAGGTGPGTSEGLITVRHGNRLLAAATEAPETAARPLDARASGLVPGDGAGAVVLETAETAAARGARPLARVAAWRDLFVAPPTPRGGASAAAVERLLRSLLQDAGWSVGDVDYIAASGIGLERVDAAEAAGIGAVFGDQLDRTVVAVHTGVTGFCEGGHACLGLVGALQAMTDGLVPPQVNLDTPRAGLERMLRVTQPTPWEVSHAVVLGTSPEGTLVALAIETS